LVRLPTDASLDAEQELPRILGRQGVQVQGKKAGQVEMLAGGYQQEAALGREQGQDLLPVGGVVQQQQGALFVEHRPVQPRQFPLSFGEPGLRVVGVDDMCHNLGCGQRLDVPALEV